MILQIIAASLCCLCLLTAPVLPAFGEQKHQDHQDHQDKKDKKDKKGPDGQQPTAVPEPSATLLLVLALGGVVALHWRRSAHRN